MKSHKNATEALTDVAQNLQDQMDKKDARTNVIVAQNRMQTINEYAFLFATNLDSIIDKYNLNKSEIRVVLKLIQYMYFGNLLSFSNNRLAMDLKIDKGNISRILKKLKKTELIIEDNGNLYFNPHIACKGTLDERKPDDRRLLDYSAMVLDEYNSPATVSIATTNIRRKIKKNISSEEDVIAKKIKEYYNEEI